MKLPVAPLVVLAAFAASPILTGRLKPLEYEGGFSADEALVQRRNSNAFAVLMGDIRANMSDLMFIKTEQYLHGGILYTPHLDMEEMSQSGQIETKGKGPKADDTRGAPSQVVAALQSDDHDHDHDGHPDHAAEDHPADDHDHDHDGKPDHAPEDHPADDHDHDHDGKPDHAPEDHPVDDHDHDHDGHPDHAAADHPADDHDHDHDGKPDHAPEEHHDEPVETIDTIIPRPEADYRGFIGALQREVKPWKDPKLGDVHGGGDELLPWYRVMTISSPNNVRAYLIGGWWLKGKRDKKFVEEARKFVLEGVENNPKSFQLRLMLGYILFQDKQFAEAKKAFIEGADLAAKLRPAEGIGKNWTEYQDEDARAAMRMAVFLERRGGGSEVALEMAEKYNKAICGDPRLEIVIDSIKKGEPAPPLEDEDTVGPVKPGT